MANTIIQIKRSTTTNAPASLSVAEQAYSYLSEKLFIGNTAGTGVIEIGGKYWVDTTQVSFDQANAAFEAANNASSNSNSGVAAAFLQANTARDQANAAYTQANLVFGQANSAYGQANLVFGQANAAYVQANTARDHANTAHLTANAAFDQANTARTHANAAFAVANAALPLTGGTISGDLIVSQNLTVSGLVTYANTQTLLIGDNIFVVNADLPSGTAPSENAGFEVNRGSSANVSLLWNEGSDKWTFTNDGTVYYNIATNTAVETAQTDATNAFVQANTARDHANTAHLTANAGYVQANTARDHANTAHLTSNAAYVQANTARDHANTAHLTANAAYVQANTARDHANAAFLQANTANTNAANASFLSTGTVPSARVSGSYTGITGVGTLTAGTWNADTIKVPYGGTGMVSFTTNGILYGNSAGDLKVTGAGTEGQVLQASSTGVPQFGMLDGGTF